MEIRFLLYESHGGGGGSGGGGGGGRDAEDLVCTRTFWTGARHRGDYFSPGRFHCYKYRLIYIYICYDTRPPSTTPPLIPPFVNITSIAVFTYTNQTGLFIREIRAKRLRGSESSKNTVLKSQNL